VVVRIVVLRANLHASYSCFGSQGSASPQAIAGPHRAEDMIRYEIASSFAHASRASAERLTWQWCGRAATRYF
jgi:hypothetical protein